MRIDAISIGNNPPHEVNVIIEVPVGGEPIKYEMDKEAGTLVVDRFLYTADALSRQLRLHPAHAVRRWRSLRRADRQHPRASCPAP